MTLTPARILLLGLMLCFLPKLHATEWSHALSYFGDTLYDASFTHFDYVNPNAPTGGMIVLPETGVFDSLNSFIRKGRPPQGLVYAREVLTNDRLMYLSQDEPSTQYGVLAEAVRLADDYSWVEFRLRPEARWHDGEPVLADDVLFTFEQIKEHGSPLLKQEFQQVTHAEITGDRQIRFHIENDDSPKTAQSVANLVIIPKHYWETRSFEETTLEPPLGSGPYRVIEVDPGRRITYERVKDYWGRDIPAMKGRYNFDIVRYEYFTSEYSENEALKAGVVDAKHENVSKRWAVEYDFPAAQQGLFRKNLIRTERPPSLTLGIIMNLRVPKLQDVRVREAIALSYNFGFSSRVLFYDFYERSDSVFVGTDLAQRGLPSEAELAILEPIRHQVPPRVFTEPYVPPPKEAYGIPRKNLLRATQLLKEAGYEVRDGDFVDSETGQPLTLDFITQGYAGIRSYMPVSETLRRIGVRATSRTVESAQYLNRLATYDFEITFSALPYALVPGQELVQFFGSKAAEQTHGLNRAGVQDPAVDYLIDKIVKAESRDALIAATRALDRVLLWNFYVIPRFYATGHRYAHWDKFGIPEVSPRFHSGVFDTWWYDEARAARIARAPGSGSRGN